jgi:aspartyl-tRNA synthetase
MATGEIEVFVEDYQILNKSIELPISINSSGLEINEELAFTVSLFRLKTSAFTK